MAKKLAQADVYTTVSIKDNKICFAIDSPDAEPWFLLVTDGGFLTTPIVTRGDGKYHEVIFRTDDASCRLRSGIPSGIKKFTNRQRSVVQKAIKEYVGKL